MVKFYRKRNGFSLIELTIAFWVILILLAIDVPKHGYGSENARRKACFENQRVFLGAIEMYNMDHSDKIQELNSEVIELLVKEKLLKGSLTDYVCPETSYKGKYLSLGNILKSGVTYCEYHGTLDGIEIKPGMTYMDYVVEREQRTRKDIQEDLKKKQSDLVKEYTFKGIILLLISCWVYEIIKFIKNLLKNKKV